MTLADFSHSLWSIVPPLLALTLALMTRKVLLSLGVGIVSGALLLNDFSLQNSALYVGSLFKGLVIDDGALNSWNMSIVAFLVLLGIITALMTLSGGARAFALWAQEKVKNKRGANLLAVGLGIFIFVDDYFNSLAVGAISRPVTDRFGTSRAKLAYILDSTAASMCVITPISSWGAYIITVIGGILLAHNVTQHSAIGAFITMIPMNFYAIFALLLVLAVAYFNLNVGPMRQLERADPNFAAREQQMTLAHQAENELEMTTTANGKVRYLVFPIIVLIVNTISAMIYTGAAKLSDDNKAFSLLGAFENTDVGLSLLFGSVTCLFVVLAIVFLQKLPVTVIAKVSLKGANSMFGAILILFFAWAIGKVIGDMQTGKYLSLFVSGSFAPQLLPVLLFLLSGLMAFSTGTSWGTFGIMLPIGGDLAMASEPMLLLPILAAVLAGSVFGDHCSPISDTTILSSTGARCDHIEHVTSQLPYALMGASIAMVSFIVLGFSNSVVLSLGCGALLFVGLCVWLRYLSGSAAKKNNVHSYVSS